MDFFSERNQKATLKLREVQAELPTFCREFFVGISAQTSALTKLNYAYDLRLFFNYMLKYEMRIHTVDTLTIGHLSVVTASHIEGFLEYLSFYQGEDGKAHRNDARGKARKLASVKALFRYFYNKDKLAHNPAAKVGTPKVHEKEIIRLEPCEVTDILDRVLTGDGLTDRQYDFHKKSYLRDAAILSMFLGTGIRISELVGLNIDDIDFKINGFTVTRKGGARVILYFPDQVAETLYEYTEERKSDAEVKPNETALFLSGQNKRISVRAVQNLVEKYAKIVSPLKHITPHKLRSTFGTNLYRTTKDIYVVAEVLGHKDVNTTKKHYAATSDDIRREAAARIKLK